MSSQYQYPDPPHQPQPAALYQPVYVQPAQPKGASITSMVLGLVSILPGFTFVFLFGLFGVAATSTTIGA